jgi:hypothetical protein
MLRLPTRGTPPTSKVQFTPTYRLRSTLQHTPGPTLRTITPGSPADFTSRHAGSSGELVRRPGARSADAVTPPSAARHVQLTKHCTAVYAAILITRAIRTQSVPLPHARAHTTFLRGGSRELFNTQRPSE